MILGFNADEVFGIAIGIEKNGIQFYEKARAAATDDNVKAMFADLKDQEEKHLRELEQMRAELPDAARRPTDYDPSDDVYRKRDEEVAQYIRDTADMNVFRKTEHVERYIAEVRRVEDALRLAIRFEKDSITFYLILKDLTEEDKGKEFVDGILKEEKEHLKRLSRELRETVGCEKMSLYQMPACTTETAMGAEQARAMNPDEPCDDSRSGA
ncbi:MAG: ferritin family protein [Deltaproteobacteria bacterium]|nr:ferritin family protein [Deltaproteobacteria bacterium]